MRVVVTARNSAGSASATSAQTAVVTAPPVNSSPPTISGTAQQGQTLTANRGTWTGSPTPTYTYQWRRCDATGGACADISGATATSYTLISTDVGKTIRVVVTATNSVGSSSATSAQTAVVTTGSTGDPVIAAAGDIACSPSDSDFNSGNGTSTHCRQKYTSNLLVNAGLAKVLTLGDNQYNSGSFSNFQNSYDLSWGRVKSITRPSAGNHEPHPSTGYFDYFNGSGVNSGPAGERGKGYYSFNVGAWHLIALNSNCPGGCGAGSAQEQWLKADLAANPNTCTLAYWHHPRYSSGHDGDNTFMSDLYKALYNAGADVVLVGHSHNYERFAPQGTNANLDQANGIREFVVGTGGAFFTGLSTPHANSQVRQNNTYGVLKLTLHPASYDWRFEPESGKSFTDSGSSSCH
jgi:acid phosphatase type 7